MVKALVALIFCQAVSTAAFSSGQCHSEVFSVMFSLTRLFQDKNARPLALSGHVGFDSLPDQLVNKSTSQGFCFNILCIGKNNDRSTRDVHYGSLN